MQHDAPESRAFDLVSLCFYPLPRANPAGVRGVFDAVTVGGMLLVVGHQPMPGGGGPHAEALKQFLGPDELTGLLDDRWDVLVDEVRPRTGGRSAGGHDEDTVLRAVRIG